MACFASTPKPTQGTHFNGQMFCGVMAKFCQTYMVTPILMIATNIIAKILIQYLIDPLGLPINLQMKSDYKFLLHPRLLHQ
jgi:hypothetical protein